MITKKFFKTLDECDVTFTYENESATDVALVCEYNGWEPLAMTRAKKAGSPYKTKVRLPKNGEFQFRYHVDNSYWANDDGADAYWPNEFGDTNSIVNTYE